VRDTVLLSRGYLSAAGRSRRMQRNRLSIGGDGSLGLLLALLDAT